MIEGKRNLNLKDLEPQIPEMAQCSFHLDAQNKLIWPVLILYPETKQTDFIQNFHEDTLYAFISYKNLTLYKKLKVISHIINLLIQVDRTIRTVI